MVEKRHVAAGGTPSIAGSLRRGATVRVGGRTAVFVKRWGSLGAVIRFDDRPNEPKVVPVARVHLA
jgi:hypothetical protein